MHTDNTLGKLEKLPTNMRMAWSDTQPNWEARVSTQTLITYNDIQRAKVVKQGECIGIEYVA